MTSATDQNKATVRDFFTVFSAGDVSGILAHLDDDAVWWVSGSVDGFSGSNTKAQMGAMLAGVTDVYTNGSLPLSPTSLVAEDDLVFVEAEGRSELKNGRVYEPRSAFVFRLRDGLIVELKEYMDTQHAFATFFAP